MALVEVGLDGVRGGKRAPRGLWWLSPGRATCLRSSFPRGLCLPWRPCFPPGGDPTAPRPAPYVSLTARGGRPAWRLPGLHSVLWGT